MVSLSETLFSIEKESSEKLRIASKLYAYAAINCRSNDLTFCLAEKFVANGIAIDSSMHAKRIASGNDEWESLCVWESACMRERETDGSGQKKHKTMYDLFSFL